MLEGRTLFAAGLGLAADGLSVVPEGDYTLNLAATGDAAPSISNWTVNWGDPFNPTETYPSGNPSPLVHNYNGHVPAGTYTITATASGKIQTATADESFVSDAVVQPDGKRVTVGRREVENSPLTLLDNQDFWEIRRFNTDGSVDATFGTGGAVTIDFGVGVDHAEAVAIDGAGNIVVAGGAGAFDEFVVARLTPGGSLDATFKNTVDDSATDGIVQTHVRAGDIASASSVVIQPDGKIVVGGSSRTSSTVEDFAFARYNADGTLDNTFDGPGGTGDGKFVVEFALPGGVTDLALRNAGVVAVGPVNGSLTGLAALTATGDLDATFDGPGAAAGNGKFTVDALPSASETATAVAVAGGSVFVGGSAGSGSVMLLKFTSTGAFDGTFGSGGKVFESYRPVPAFADFSATIANVVVQADGSIVAGGTLNNSVFNAPNGNTAGLAVFRFDGAGARDVGFGTDGVVYTPGGTSNSGDVSGGDVSLIGPGRIIQSGTAEDVPGSNSGNSDSLAVYHETATRVVTVSNVAPTAAFASTNPANVLPGDYVFYEFTPTDPSNEDAAFLTYHVEWGDGTSDEFSGAPFGIHAYTVSGPQTLTLTVTDDDGASATATSTVTVAVAGIVQDVFDPGQTNLVVADTDGGRGNLGNHFTVRNSGAGQEVRINGLLHAVFPATDRVIIYANAGDDDVDVALDFPRPVELYGGAGDDRLRGGAKNDILVGGSGKDLLVGGSGRDLVIGDDDARPPSGVGWIDRIVGDADDDILIGGFTLWASRRDALNAILREWGSARTYAERVDNLRDGSGTAQRENWLTFTDPETNQVFVIENYFLDADVTVLDDGVVDTLTGSAGQDWFFANADGSLRDKITDLAADELVSDLDFIFAP